MRLSELTKPSEYQPTEAELANFLEDIEGLWPGHIDVPLQMAPPVEEKMFDAINGMQCTRHWVNR